MPDLRELALRLRKELKTDAEFSFINTRIILRTGVDLTKLGEARADAGRAAKVLQILQEMGYLGGVR
jgi:hypothetical protein